MPILNAASFLNSSTPTLVKQKVWYPLIELGISVDATTEQLESVETANAVVAEHGTNSGLASMELDEGEKIRGLLHLPSWFDRNHDLDIYVVFSSASVTALDDFEWLMLYEAISLDGTVPCVATVNDALDTVIPATTKGGTTADTMQQAGPGVIAGGTLDDDIEFLQIDLEADVADTAVDLFGILCHFTPKFYSGRQDEASAWANV
jgi:hypothetical protein